MKMWDPLLGNEEFQGGNSRALNQRGVHVTATKLALRLRQSLRHFSLPVPEQGRWLPRPEQ